MGEFNATLLENNANSQNTYMCGDYNVDLLKVNNTQFNDDYFHNILSAGYIPKVTLPTRLSESSTLIDNVFTTNLNSDLSAYILDIHMSDHQPVVLFTNDDIPPTRSKYITIRANTDDRKDNFRQCFHNKHIFDQLDKDIHVTDPNYNYEILEHAIKKTHSECFPERRVRLNAKKHKKTPRITHQESHFGDYLTGANNCSFAFHLIDNTTTLRIIKNTKSSTSKGHDGISSEFLKLITADVSK